MRKAIISFYNAFAKYFRSKLKPRLLYVDIDFSIKRQSLVFKRLSKKYSIYTKSACPILQISPYKYDLLLFTHYNLWRGVSCNLHFEQVILLIGCNACRISNAAIDESDENKIRSAGTLICDRQDTFDYYSKIHPRVFLCKKLELTHTGKYDSSDASPDIDLQNAVDDALRYSRKPKFRNDDISAENNLKQLVEFCDIFSSHGFSQVHGVLLKGKTSESFCFNGEEVAYEGYPSISKLTNNQIRDLSRGYDFESRTDLINYLAGSPDEIALHGLYHTDHSTMSIEELRTEMGEGLSTLRRLFSSKPIRFFIAPFNRTSPLTYQVAAELGLRVLALDGVHLEGGLSNLHLEPSQWYRYHHHRFYPESKFPHFSLSISSLRAAISRQKLAERSLN